MTPEPKESITIHLDQDDATALKIPIEIISSHLGLDREATIVRVLLFGSVLALDNINEKQQRRIDCLQGIRKMKAGEKVPAQELAAVFHEADAGDLAAQIIVEDFMRFGRSMEKM